MDKTRYPSNWNAISHRIRFERAGGKCEQCGAMHGDLIWRKKGTAEFITDPHAYPDGEYSTAAVRVILTVHHIGVPKPDGSAGDPHDKLDCRDENLIALCQRCHLIADMETHKRNAAVTRARKMRQAKIDGGNVPLFEDAL